MGEKDCVKSSYCLEFNKWSHYLESFQFSHGYRD